MKTRIREICLLLPLLLFQIHETLCECRANTTCTYTKENSALTCGHTLANNTSAWRNIQSLKICDYQQNTLNLSDIFRKHHNLTNITILGGKISSVILDEELVNNMKVINLNQFSLKYMSTPSDAVKNLIKLDVKDGKIHLKENKWNCSKNLDWLLKLKPMVENADNLTCHGEPYDKKPLYPIAELLQRLRHECPNNCNCSMPHIIKDDINTGKLEPIIQVNCSNRALLALPPQLPNNTKILLLQDNLIGNLSLLKDNPDYSTVHDLYLDDNQVESIEGLEGTEWFTRFRILSLRGNKLTKLPTYALDNALERNMNMPKAVRIFLGGNPWRCDCIYTPIFQEILQKYQAQIADVEDVKCMYLEGDENSLLPILSLSRSSVCRPSTEYSVRALDLLNIVLASLIVLILSKLAYDYYHFKKTGKLPWIVMKMP